jgi:hypothetical protein
MSSKSEIFACMAEAASNIGGATHEKIYSALRGAGHLKIDDNVMHAAAAGAHDVYSLSHIAARSGGQKLVTLADCLMAAKAGDHAVKSMLATVNGMTQRMGVDLPVKEPIDAVALDKEIRASRESGKASLQDAIDLKGLLYRLQVIPA